MSHKPTLYNFFAVREDLVAVLQAVESAHDLKYVECGLFDVADGPVFHGFSALPNLGIAVAGDSNFEATFLVLRRDAALAVREVPQRRGGTKYAVNQLDNPGTLVLRPGGKYGDSAIIAGMVGTVHRDNGTEQLSAAFFKEFKAAFTEVSSYIVGPEAKKLLHKGVRFTKSIKSPSDFDLAS